MDPGYSGWSSYSKKVRDKSRGMLGAVFRGKGGLIRDGLKGQKIRGVHIFCLAELSLQFFQGKAVEPAVLEEVPAQILVFFFQDLWQQFL
jgi:hypothetical protein